MLLGIPSSRFWIGCLFIPCVHARLPQGDRGSRSSSERRSRKEAREERERRRRLKLWHHLQYDDLSPRMHAWGITPPQNHRRRPRVKLLCLVIR